MNDFDGLAALVTGGASGIGLATAHFLAARGARVACLDLTVDGLPDPLIGVVGEGKDALRASAKKDEAVG